ncbi:hypothetical protein Pst134EA_022413 [Puccinia striiformis f. sp. tritici]|nr:hypothetical protein Pst134EA_022413 [Puccinia striiformis f. sp. tritici]KAH9454924.1 hypothetical protein Pst134EA_022413 [Puccinia striiformis f. sp. tritici]KNE96242.1 hypothetical protein, variant [Puccinia striiformis f. sp. tritici PST-78]
MRKYDVSSPDRAFTGTPVNMAFEHVDELNFKEILYKRLHSCLLPRLRRQLTTLESLFDEDVLTKQPSLSLRRISEMQSEIDHNWSQIESAVNIVCPEPLSSTHRTDDQQLKQFKSYRLHHLRTRCHVILDQIRSIYYAACDHIERMELSTTEEFACKTDPNWTSTVDITTEETLDLITSAIYCTNGSELDAAEDRWKSPVQAGMNGVLERAMCVSKKYPSAMWHHRMVSSKSSCHLTKLAIPIIKLSRLFFTKLSRRGINRKRLPFFTAMNSKQIKSLCDSASPILNDLLRLLDILLRADRVTGGHTISVRDINQIAETIHRHFETPMLLAMLYIVPLYPDNDCYPDQNYLKSWFVTWNTQMILAVNNFKHTVRALHHMPL